MRTILFTTLSVLFLLIPDLGLAQLISLTGYVNNGVNGKSLQNASIFEANSGIGTITDQDGYYKLMLEKGALSLLITDDGFQDFSKIIELKSDTTLIVNLQPKSLLKFRQKQSNELQAGASKLDKKIENRRGFKLF